MEIAWLFGVLFGMIGGFGAHHSVKYHECIKDKSVEVCKKEHGVK